MIFYLFFGITSVYASSNVIYHLNDSEYDRMPPIYELDKYDSCLREKEGIYCWAKLELYTNQPNELFSLIEKYSAYSAKHYNHRIIERGICISKRCQQFVRDKNKGSPEDLKQSLEACANEMMWNEYKLQAKVEKHFCDKHNEEAEKDIYDWMVLYGVLILIAFNIAGTFCDVMTQEQDHEKNNNYGLKNYLNCFSIFQNWNSLVVSGPEEPRLKSLKGLHGIKCLVMQLFIIGHAFLLYSSYTVNTHDFEKLYDNSAYKMIFCGLISVQILFVISGFLLVYFLEIESEKRPITWKMVPTVVLMRLWRLSPVNAVFVLFSATWLRHAGSGPNWKNIVSSRMSGDCRKYWWAHLLFVNNNIADDRECVVPNWQLAVDTQLFILGLCIFVSMRSKLQITMFNAMILIGMASVALHIWWEDLDAFTFLNPEFYREFNHRNSVVHKATYVNIPGFFIGMLTGKLVYEMQKRNTDLAKHKKIFTLLSHFAGPAFIGLLLSGSIFSDEGDRASLGVRMAYGMAIRPLLSLITAFAVIVIVFKLSDSWSTFLEWDGWVIPSRLTYSVSLIHTFFIIYKLGARRHLIELNVLDHTLSNLGITALSLICAVPYYVLVEAPFHNLSKVIIKKNVNRTKKIS